MSLQANPMVRREKPGRHSPRDFVSLDEDDCPDALYS